MIFVLDQEPLDYLLSSSRLIIKYYLLLPYSAHMIILLYSISEVLSCGRVISDKNAILKKKGHQTVQIYINNKIISSKKSTKYYCWLFLLSIIFTA